MEHLEGFQTHMFISEKNRYFLFSQTHKHHSFLIAAFSFLFFFSAETHLGNGNIRAAKFLQPRKKENVTAGTKI